MKPTRIEQLDGTHPGLRLDVDSMFDASATHEAVVAMLKERYDETVPLSTLSSYKLGRYDPRMKDIRDKVTTTLAIREIYQRFGITAIAEAKALEQLDEIAPAALLRESRQRMEGEGRMEIERSKLAQAKAELDLKRDELVLEREKFEALVKRALNEVENEAESKDGQELSPKEIVDSIRERVWGIGPRSTEGNVSAGQAQG